MNGAALSRAIGEGVGACVDKLALVTTTAPMTDDEFAATVAAARLALSSPDDTAAASAIFTGSCEVSTAFFKFDVLILMENSIDTESDASSRSRRRRRCCLYIA